MNRKYGKLTSPSTTFGNISRLKNNLMNRKYHWTIDISNIILHQLYLKILVVLPVVALASSEHYFRTDPVKTKNPLEYGYNL